MTFHDNISTAMYSKIAKENNKYQNICNYNSLNFDLYVDWHKNKQFNDFLMYKIVQFSFNIYQNFYNIHKFSSVVLNEIAVNQSNNIT